MPAPDLFRGAFRLGAEQKPITIGDGDRKPLPSTLKDAGSNLSLSWNAVDQARDADARPDK